MSAVTKHPLTSGVVVLGVLFLIGTGLIMRTKPAGTAADFAGMSIEDIHRKVDMKSLAVAQAYDFF